MSSKVQRGGTSGGSDADARGDTRHTVRKAVIPAAGFGTRFLPATKAVPKEMLPVIDTPTIEFVVREAIDSGLDDILIILSAGKEAIQAHFGRNGELEARLEATGKMEELASVRRFSGSARIHYVFQQELSGLGDAVRYARNHVGAEPFAILLGDTILEGGEGGGRPARPVTRQLLDVFESHRKSVVALEQVPEEKVSRYGIVAAEPLGGSANAESSSAARSGRTPPLGSAPARDSAPASDTRAASRTYRLTDLIEKPSPSEAPSLLAISSRYVFTPAIFHALDSATPGKGGEIQLTDAMRALQRSDGMFGLQFAGRRYDMGNRLDFLKAVVEFALRREDLGPDFASWLKSVAVGL